MSGDEIKLYMLQSGTLKCKVHNIKMNQGDGEDYEIPVPFFLITHPKGHIIIDGGNAIEVAHDPRGYWGDICDIYEPVLDPGEGCVDQLRRLGIEPEDVRYVVQSHLHLDHTGAIGRFPNATHVVQRTERGGSRNLNSGDKWIADLTAAMLAAKRKQDEQATPPEPQSGIQGQGGAGCCEG